MKRIYLHMGMHKTGSSSIQKSLFESRHILKEQGYHYFCEDYDGLEKSLPQNWINLNDFERPKISDYDRFLKLLDKIESDNILISIESFSWFFTMESISYLKKLFDKYEVKIILYIRRQDSQMVSYIQEGAKNRNKPSARYYGNFTVSLPFVKNLDYLNYYNRANNLSAYFGKSNLTIRVFEKNKLYGGDVVSDFCQILGLKGVLKSRVNESLGFMKQKVGQLINCSDLNVRSIDSLIRSNMPNYGKMLPNVEKAKNFYEIFKESNIKLNNEYDLSDFPDVFNHDFSMYPDKSSDLWTEDLANEAIISILNSIQQYSSKLENEHVNLLRDYAIAVENENIQLAYKLMSQAYEIRPNGPVIKDKLSKYKALIEKETSL